MKLSIAAIIIGMLTGSSFAQDWTLIAHLNGNVVNDGEYDIANLNSCSSKQCKMSDAEINALNFDLIKFEPVPNDASKPITYFDFSDRIFSSVTAVDACSTPWTLDESKANARNFDGEETCCLYQVCNFGRGHCDNTVKSSYGFQNYGGCGGFGTIVGISGVAGGETRIWVNVASGAAPPEVSITAPTTDTGCDVTVNSSGGSVSCEFLSTCNAGNGWCSLFSGIQAGTCASDDVTLDNTEVPATATTKEEAVLSSTASMNFASSLQGCNLNGESGKCTYNFCARADLWGGYESYEMSVLASLVDVAIDVTYLKTGEFSATVSTAAFEAADAVASDSRSVTLSAELVKEGGCTAKYGEQETPESLIVGSTARICIEPDDSDVVIASLESVRATYGTASKNQELVTAAGDATFIASITGKDTADVLLEFLMLPDFFDASSGDASTITVSGKANLRYTRRRLNESRKLQESDESAPFELEITVEKGDMPEIAKADGGNSGFRVASGVFTIFAGAGVAML